MKYHDIDNELIKYFLINNHSTINEIIKKDVIDWHLALHSQNEKLCRKYAINLVNNLIKENISFLGLNTNLSNEELFKIYEPLENILRITTSLRNDERIRDHLNHIIRNIIFTSYISNYLRFENTNNNLNKLIIACAFHDIAYPIEKLKKVAKNIIDSTLGELISSQGKIDIYINNPEKLLEFLDFWANELYQKLSTEEKVKNSILYRFTLIPAIAGQGIFESKHCYSSSYIFLRYLYDSHNQDKNIFKNHFSDIIDICLAISYHDRDRNLKELNDISNYNEIIKILRFVDEIQEWDRDDIEYSYYEDVKISSGSGLCFEFYMKNREKGKTDNLQCNPFHVIKDKITGICKLFNSEIKLSFIFPQNLNDIIINGNKINYKKEITNFFCNKEIEINFIDNKDFKQNQIELIVFYNTVTITAYGWS